MRHQEALTVVSAPVDRVEAWLARVDRWPGFVVGLEAVTPVRHERCRFLLVDGRDRREVLVCVRHHPAVHRFAWHALEGPRYAGVIDLRAVDDRHTSVHLALTAHPASWLAGLAEMVLPRLDRAALDLRRLADGVLASGG